MGRMIRSIDRYSMVLLATVLLASVLPCRGAVADALSVTSKVAIALLFFLHGAKLSREAILAGLLNWKLHLLVLGCTFVMFPLLGLGLSGLAGQFLTPALVSGILFLTLLPSTVQSSIAFTSIAGGNVPAAVCAASISNMAGIFITPVLAAVLMHNAGGSAGSLAAIEAIALQLLLPFIVGHLARPLVGGVIGRNKSVVSLADRGSILLVVYTAFSASMVGGIWTSMPPWQLLAMLVLMAVLLTIVLLFTTVAARKLGFSTEDEAAIVFCGAKKSLASGVPIAGVLFAPEQVGAIILPLMVFHQLQLLACASLAQRYARRAQLKVEVNENAPIGAD